MKFTMPYGQVMEIRPSKGLSFDEEMDIGQEEEIDGLTWHVFINEKESPWFTKNKLQATAIALGIQYGAYYYMK